MTHFITMMLIMYYYKHLLQAQGHTEMGIQGK